MNLATLAWKSIRQRSLSSLLTSLSVALGVTVMVAVLVIYSIVQSTFNQRAINYDLIVGPKGSPLQLVLSTVYHVAPAIETLPYRYYRELKDHPLISLAIPIAIGDTTEKGGFPIVGTIPEYFEQDYIPGRPYLVDGRFVVNPFESVIGAEVAKANNWKLGDDFRMVHGGADTGHVHDERFKIVGILAPTFTPSDRSVFVHLEGFYAISGHEKPFSEAIVREREFFGEPPLSPDELKQEVARLRKKYGVHFHSDGHECQLETAEMQKDVSAILLQMKSPVAAPLFDGQMKKGFKAIAVNPIGPMQKLLNDILTPVVNLLLVLTVLVILVSAIGVFVSIYNSMAERRKEIAIMRALGADRMTVLSIIICEAILLCVVGGVLGLLLGHGLVLIGAPFLEARTGTTINPFRFHPAELALFPILIMLAGLAGLVPGLTAYRTDVASNLNG